MCKKTERMSPEQLAHHRAKATERQRKLRAKMTPEQKAVRAAKIAERNRLYPPTSTRTKDRLVALVRQTVCEELARAADRHGVSASELLRALVREELAKSGQKTT